MAVGRLLLRRGGLENSLGAPADTFWNLAACMSTGSKFLFLFLLPHCPPAPRQLRNVRLNFLAGKCWTVFEEVFIFPNHSPSPRHELCGLLFIYLVSTIFLWRDGEAVLIEEGLENPCST